MEPLESKLYYTRERKGDLSNKHQLLILLSFVLLGFIITFVWMDNRPAFLEVQKTPSLVDTLKNEMRVGFSAILARMDKQDSVMQRVPKIFPAPGARISSSYGMRDSVMHWGIDIAQKKGSPIYAMVSGKVIEAGWDDGYGNCTILDSGIFLVRVAHQDKMYVAVGQIVKQGDLIGTVGSTGNSSGAHEHIEIIQDGKHRNPVVFTQ